ncbi:response regulator [Spirochaeta lutea]|uniref:response regulator n=1 Tax=Spirochaeta lutea TaxID=1480694 RepID=UPI00068F1043|nr:response regulator [Spirochaeta lutea]
MSKRILMIDDELPILEAFTTILADFGFEVNTCADAREGADTASAEFFDLVLVDLRMPDMDGAEVTRQIRQNQPETTILIITGYPSDPLIRQALDYGAVGVIKKPFDVGKILDLLGD